MLQCYYSFIHSVRRPVVPRAGSAVPPGLRTGTPSCTLCAVDDTSRGLACGVSLHTCRASARGRDPREHSAGSHTCTNRRRSPPCALLVCAAPRAQARRPAADVRCVPVRREGDGERRTASTHTARCSRSKYALQLYCPYTTISPHKRRGRPIAHFVNRRPSCRRATASACPRRPRSRRDCGAGGC